MKQFLAIIIFFTVPILVHSQVRMGPKLGLNVVSPKFNNDVGISLPLKADANVGVFFSKDFKNGDKIQIELNYYTKVDVEFDSAGTQIAVMNDVGFIAIPLQYGFKFGKSNIYGLMGVSFLFSRAWTNFDDGDLDPVYNLMAPSGGSTSSSSNAMGVGAKLGLEYYYNKLSIMIYYEYPFITDNLYVVNESKLSFSHFGLSLYYNIVK